MTLQVLPKGICGPVSCCVFSTERRTSLLDTKEHPAVLPVTAPHTVTQIPLADILRGMVHERKCLNQPAYKRLKQNHVLGFSLCGLFSQSCK